MGEKGQIVVAIILLIGVYFLSRRVQMWRMRRAYASVLKDLRARGAGDASSAVKIPYARKKIFNVGMKDFRPKAVEFLVMNDLIGRTPEDTFYLKEKGAVALEGIDEGRMA
jgi:hypothetical protein